MCGRYGRWSRKQRLEMLLGLIPSPETGNEERYNIPGTRPLIARGNSNGVTFDSCLWGLVPFLSKNPNSRVRPINAIAETAHEKPMFRTLIRERRCLVPADCFYEWKSTPAGKIAYCIRMADKETFLYCEHGAITRQLRKYQHQGLFELFNFPYDPDSWSKRLFRRATPSNAWWIDMTLPWSEYRDPWADYCASEHYESVSSIVGRQNRRDALHLDSAYRSECVAFIKRDRDTLDKRADLQQLLALRIFHPASDAAELERFVIGALR